MNARPWHFIVSFAAGGLLCAAIVLWATHGAGEKLNDDLKRIRDSLASAIATNASATATIRGLHNDLDDRDKLIAGQQRELTSDQHRLADQQRTISGQQSTITDQQSIIDGQKRAIDAIATEVASAGGDLAKTARAVADGFKRLYAFYHKSSG